MPVNPDVPPLEDYITLPEAAAVLGISKQAAHQQRGNFHSLRRLGNRAVYVVRMSEVEEQKAKRAAALPVAVKRVKRFRKF